MKKKGTLFIYSKLNSLEIKSGEFEVCLQGAPAKIDSKHSSDNWINNIISDFNSIDSGYASVLFSELQNTSGLFSLIIKTKNELILASDIIRSFPIFYGYKDDKLFITDSLEEYQIENGLLEIDYGKLEEFFVFGLVLNNRTIYKSVYSLQAGEIVTIRNVSISSELYFVFKPAEKPLQNESLINVTKALDKCFLFAFSRLIEMNPDVNRWVIPLSGGHDSRLVVNYLYRLGVKNVICYSYGNEDNAQSLISKQVARAVGYEWYFVEYTRKKWQALHDNGIFDEYINFAFNGVSTPHLQDFLAINELKARGRIKDGDVFLPGHTVITETVFNGDTQKLTTIEEALHYVYNRFGVMTNWSQNEESIHNALQKMYSESEISPKNFTAYFDWKERQAKFIGNSNKVYEFFGFESLQPMWDRKIVDLWLSIPDKEREGREILYETEKSGGLIEALARIPFFCENEKSIKLSLSGMLKKILPAKVVAWLLLLTKSEVKLNEGLNLIYALKAKSVKEILDPIEDFSINVLPFFSDCLDRFPYQMNYNILTSFYTIRKQLDKSKIFMNNMQSIILVNKSWSICKDTEASVSFIGYVDFEENFYLTADDLAIFIRKKDLRGTELQDFLYEYFLPKAIGNFAFIIENKSQCILACDFSRNYPLYIINDNSKTIITDHIGLIPFKKEHDQSAQEEFLLSGIVTGNRTVFKNVKGLQAGEMATIKDASIQFHRYFILMSDPFRLNSQMTTQTIYQEMDNLFLAAFKRMIKSCPNMNNWIVPLSGGHDSRLIINYLYRLGCRNVICFSYGIASSKEAEVSRLTANALGYKWHFIEYTPEDWEKMHSNRLFDRYINYSFNGCCLPHPQDLLAIFKLKELKIIDENDVVVPGHTALTEAENLIVKGLSTKKQALRYVYDKYYILFHGKNNHLKLESNLLKLYERNEQKINSYPEFFNWQERQAKFINNSLRAYEFFGLQWRLPFWESGIIDLWQKINFDDRIERAILFSASREYLFHDALKDVPIINKYDKKKPSESVLRKYIPDKLLSLIIRIINRKTSVAEGTNYVYALKAATVKEIVGPKSLYPSRLIKYFASSLERRPYQVNVNSLTAIYTLKNEVLSEPTLNKND